VELTPQHRTGGSGSSSYGGIAGGGGFGFGQGALWVAEVQVIRQRLLACAYLGAGVYVEQGDGFQQVTGTDH
jgi:tryptophanase